MKEILKNSWWKVPIYCIITGWITFQLEVYIGGSFLITTLPNGAIATNTTNWFIIQGIWFCAALIGGSLCFRRMSKQELFCSASVMVLFNILGGLIVHFFQSVVPLGGIYAQASNWTGWIHQVVCNIGINPWVGVVLAWAIPYLFVFFGKRTHEGGVIK
ncbi:MAG: hypothetical protein IKC03_03425 [Oscillospiraceae bacterium]|nr:hypothetical protein [Oscillospiraceae bacterium]